MVFAYKKDGRWREVAGCFTLGEGDDALQYPANWPDLATENERAAVGIFVIEEPQPTPATERVIGSEIVGDKAPQRVWITEEIPLDELRAAKWAAAEAIRDAEVSKGFAVPGVGTFHTDLESRSNITGAVVGAVVSQLTNKPFSTPWKLAGDVVVQFDGPQMIACGMAVLSGVTGCHANAQKIGKAIAAAKDIAALDAIDIEAGYPVKAS